MLGALALSAIGTRSHTCVRLALEPPVVADVRMGAVKSGSCRRTG
jgi:hypothetical protein